MASKKKASNPKTKKQTLKGVLKIIAGFLNKETPESLDLWYILTALRGPDFPQGTYAKLATTAVIRNKVGVRAYSLIPATVEEDCSEYVVNRQNVDVVPYGHFRAHAADAFRALGLKWDELN